MGVDRAAGPQWRGRPGTMLLSRSACRARLAALFARGGWCGEGGGARRGMGRSTDARGRRDRGWPHRRRSLVTGAVGDGSGGADSTTARPGTERGL
jgi:hypothetical protein